MAKIDAVWEVLALASGGKLFDERIGNCEDYVGLFNCVQLCPLKRRSIGTWPMTEIVGAVVNETLPRQVLNEIGYVGQRSQYHWIVQFKPANYPPQF